MKISWISRIFAFESFLWVRITMHFLSFHVEGLTYYNLWNLGDIVTSLFVYTGEILAD